MPSRAKRGRQSGMRILYTIGICLYSFGVRVAALFGNPKAKLWVKGRKDQKSMSMSKGLSENDGDWIWFHAASLGEFEQGRPVIEALKRDFPQCKILLSFFSPMISPFSFFSGTTIAFCTETDLFFG